MHSLLSIYTHEYTDFSHSHTSDRDWALVTRLREPAVMQIVREVHRMLITSVFMIFSKCWHPQAPGLSAFRPEYWLLFKLWTPILSDLVSWQIRIFAGCSPCQVCLNNLNLSSWQNEHLAVQWISMCLWLYNKNNSSIHSFASFNPFVSAKFILWRRESKCSFAPGQRLFKALTYHTVHSGKSTRDWTHVRGEIKPPFSHQLSCESDCALTIGPLVNHFVDPYLLAPFSEAHYTGILMGSLICPYRLNIADLRSPRAFNVNNKDRMHILFTWQSKRL